MQAVVIMDTPSRAYRRKYIFLLSLAHSRSRLAGAPPRRRARGGAHRAGRGHTGCDARPTRDALDSLTRKRRARPNDGVGAPRSTRTGAPMVSATPAREATQDLPLPTAHATHDAGHLAGAHDAHGSAPTTTNTGRAHARRVRSGVRSLALDPRFDPRGGGARRRNMRGRAAGPPSHDLSSLARTAQEASRAPPTAPSPPFSPTPAPSGQEHHHSHLRRAPLPPPTETRKGPLGCAHARWPRHPR